MQEAYGGIKNLYRPQTTTRYDDQWLRIPTLKVGFHPTANTTLKDVNSRIIFMTVKTIKCVKSISEKQKCSNLINPQTRAYIRSVAGRMTFCNSQLYNAFGPKAKEASTEHRICKGLL